MRYLLSLLLSVGARWSSEFMLTVVLADQLNRTVRQNGTTAQSMAEVSNARSTSILVIFVLAVAFQAVDASALPVDRELMVQPVVLDYPGGETLEFAIAIKSQLEFAKGIFSQIGISLTYPELVDGIPVVEVLPENAARAVRELNPNGSNIQFDDLEFYSFARSIGNPESSHIVPVYFVNDFQLASAGDTAYALSPNFVLRQFVDATPVVGIMIDRAGVENRPFDILAHELGHVLLDEWSTARTSLDGHLNDRNELMAAGSIRRSSRNTPFVPGQFDKISPDVQVYSIPGFQNSRSQVNAMINSPFAKDLGTAAFRPVSKETLLGVSGFLHEDKDFRREPNTNSTTLLTTTYRVSTGAQVFTGSLVDPPQEEILPFRTLQQLVVGEKTEIFFNTMSILSEQSLATGEIKVTYTAVDSIGATIETAATSVSPGIDRIDIFVQLERPLDFGTAPDDSCFVEQVLGSRCGNPTLGTSFLHPKWLNGNLIGPYHDSVATLKATDAQGTFPADARIDSTLHPTLHPTSAGSTIEWDREALKGSWGWWTSYLVSVDQWVSAGRFDSADELDNWDLFGDGSAELVAVEGEVGTAVKLTAGSPVGLSQLIDTPEVPFEVRLDYDFLTTTGDLSVFLGPALLGHVSAPDVMDSGFLTLTLTASASELLGLNDAALEFRLDGVTESEILLDNVAVIVTLPAVPEPSAGLTMLSVLTVVAGRRIRLSN